MPAVDQPKDAPVKDHFERHVLLAVALVAVAEVSLMAWLLA